MMLGNPIVADGAKFVIVSGTLDEHHHHQRDNSRERRHRRYHPEHSALSVKRSLPVSSRYSCERVRVGSQVSEVCPRRLLMREKSIDYASVASVRLQVEKLPVYEGIKHLLANRPLNGA